MRPLVLTVCSVLLAATLLPGVATASPRGPGVGDMAPALLGQDPDGKPVTLDAWHGKLVVVAFWNTKCAYCLVEVPTLEKLQQRSEEHTSELQSLMRISYAVFCLKTKKKQTATRASTHITNYQRTTLMT